MLAEKLEQLKQTGTAKFARDKVSLTGVKGSITLETYKGKRTVEGGYLLCSPKNKGFTDELKSLLPWYALWWDESHRAWWVSAPYVTAVVLDVIGDYFDPALKAELERVRTRSAPAIEHMAGVY
jgi:hypothetical protein